MSASDQNSKDMKVSCRKVIMQKDIVDGYALSPMERKELEQGKLERRTAVRLCGNGKRADTLVDIMERFDMLIPQSSETRVQEYLVPCMMKRIACDKVPPRVKNIPILHFKFAHREFIEADKEGEGVFLPQGLFHRVFSRCCQIKEWNSAEPHSDYIEFSTDKGLVFYLRMAYDSILLCATKIDTSYQTEDQRREALSNLREDIQSIIDNVLRMVFPNLTCVHYLECITEGHQHRYNTI